MAEALTVLLPTHGRATLLRRTLDSLAEARLPETYAETVVVENGPKADAEALVAAAAAAHPALRLRYVHVERANKSAALNAALATVAPGLAVFFDDDIRLAEGALAAYAEAAAHGPGVYFGGPMGIDYEKPPPDWLVPLFPWSVRGYDLDGPRPGYFLGANWAVFTEDLAAAGGFDPNYGPGSPTGARGQETNMQERLLERGVEPVDVPGARVWHHVPRERSTPEWTLQRHYRAGLSRGIQARRERNRRTVLEAAKYAVRALPRAASALLRRGSPEWYTVVLPLSWRLGILRGYALPTST